MQQDVSNSKPEKSTREREQATRTAALDALPTLLRLLEPDTRNSLRLKLVSLLAALADAARPEAALACVEQHARELDGHPDAMAIYEMAFIAATGASPESAAADMAASPWEPEFITFATTRLVRAFMVAAELEKSRTAREMLRDAAGVASERGDAFALAYAVCNAVYDGDRGESWQMVLVAEELLRVAAGNLHAYSEAPAVEKINQAYDTTSLAVEILDAYLATKGGA